jgi:hypothetical protein
MKKDNVIDTLDIEAVEHLLRTYTREQVELWALTRNIEYAFEEEK